RSAVPRAAIRPSDRRANATLCRLRSGASPGREIPHNLEVDGVPQAAPATKTSPAMSLWLRICKGRLSLGPAAVEAYRRLFLFAAGRLFPCKIAALCTPARVHPDPLRRVGTNLLFDGARGRGGQRLRIALAVAGARDVDAAEVDSMHAR